MPYDFERFLLQFSGKSSDNLDGADRCVLFYFILCSYNKSLFLFFFTLPQKDTLTEYGNLLYLEQNEKTNFINKRNKRKGKKISYKLAKVNKSL